MDFLIELVKGTISRLGELAVDSTMKQLEYFHHKKLIVILKEEQKKLEGKKEILEAWVDARNRNGDVIEPNVKKWLFDIESFENELQRFFENKVKKNKKCFNGKCPNLAFNYSLGKQAAECIEYITRLNEERKELQLISIPKPPPSLGSMFHNEDIKSMESRNKIIREVIQKLKDDKFKRIAICGMGGVGKTTLAKEVIQIIEKYKIFDMVVMVVVSQNPNYEKIQSQIADGLGLGMTSLSIEGRGRELLQRFKDTIDHKKVLIVLDDVWEELNFEIIGLPSRDYQIGSKLLFTSRYEKVCQKMGSQENIPIFGLPQDEAWHLFQAMAGDVVYKPDVYPIAKHVANECGGLPLAIVTVGKALENEEKTIWDNALEQLRNSQSSPFFDMQKLVYTSIELSFNFLDSREHKLILMLCALFPEDFDIPIESLLRHAMGLGLFILVGARWKARNQVHTLVRDLKKCFLLLDSDVAGCVKMRDVVRDAIISIPFKMKHWFTVQDDVKWLKEMKLDDIKAISLILNETAKLENDLEFPALRLLQVQSNSKEPIFWPQHFFHGMIALKVFSAQNLYIQKLPSLFKATLNLHTMQLEHCDVGDISVIGKELIHLQALSYAYSNIKQIPTEIGNLSSLELLDLTGCNNLNYFSPNVFTRLSRLKELYLRIENFPWKKNDVVINELKKMSYQFKVVEIKVRVTEILALDLDFKSLKKFWVYVDSYTNFQRSAYLESYVLQVSVVDYTSIKNNSMILQLIDKCDILAIRKVKNLKNIVSQLVNHQLAHLKVLRVDSCHDLIHLVDCIVPCNVFPQVQSIYLKNLTKLREICNTIDHSEVKMSMIDFPNLLKLELTDLPSFIGFNRTAVLNEFHQVQSMSSVQTTLSMNTKLFSSIWMQKFPKLETIMIQNCSSINTVFDIDVYSHLDGHVFPGLKEIKMVKLKQLRRIWSTKAVHSVQGFQNLKSLTISECDSITHVFIPAIVTALTNIQKLKIESCEFMENLVTRNEEDDHKNEKIKVNNVMTFGKLDSLKLKRLPRITRVCSDFHDKLELPFLRKLLIDDCPELNISCLLTACAKHGDPDIVSYSNTSCADIDLEERYSRSCNSLCSKLICQSNKNRKTIKLHDQESAVSERKNKDGVSLLEELFVCNCDLQVEDQSRIRGGGVIDGHLFPNLKSLFMKSCNKISVLLCPNSPLRTLEKLQLEDCESLKEIVSQEEEIGTTAIFPALQHLILARLPNLKVFFQGSYGLNFPSLKNVEIINCVNMEAFSQGPSLKAFEENYARDERRIMLGDASLFPNLTSLVVQRCHKISIMFSHLSLSSLEHLENLKVSSCENLEQIITSQKEMEASRNEIMLPRLQCLQFENLPKLKAFCLLSSYNFYFPSLQQVEISDCLNMEVFSQGSSHTPKLEDVTTKATGSFWNCYAHTKDMNAIIQGFKAFVASKRCEKLSWTRLHNEGSLIREININAFSELSMLVPFREIQNFKHLETLDIRSCDSLVEVFESGGGCTKIGDTTTTHYQLRSMTLYDLTKLSVIWKHNITETISFEKLEIINVWNCHKLKSLLSYSMAKNLKQLRRLSVAWCNKMEEVVTKKEEEENIYYYCQRRRRQ